MWVVTWWCSNDRLNEGSSLSTFLDQRECFVEFENVDVSVAKDPVLGTDGLRLDQLPQSLDPNAS